MLSLGKIIKKNFKLLVRSKSSALIIILGPLLVIFLVGIAFDNLNQYSLSIGTFSEGYSELTNSFVTKMEAKDYKVQRMETKEECIEMVKQGRLNTCIIFPKDMSLESSTTNEIEFHVDNSKINLVWMILDTLSSKLGERASELSMDLTAELLGKIDMTKDELYKIRPTLVNIKTESKKTTDSINNAFDEQLSENMGEFKTKREDIKSNLLGKVTGMEDVIQDIRNELDDTNLTDDEKTGMETKLNEMDTFLFNVRGKFIKQGSVEADWVLLTNTLNEVDAGLRESLNSIKASLGSSDSKINEVQTSIDKVYEEVTGITIEDAATIVNPITTSIKPVATEKSYLNYLFPSLIVLVIMFISLLLSNTLVMMEKHSPAYFRNFITPTKDIVFILGTYLTNVLLVFVQLAIILGISAYFFKAQVLASAPQTMVILLLTITFFTFVGMAIGYIFNSEETSTLAAISLGSIFLFLSNVILPLESMPAYVRDIAQYNPFVLGESLLRRAIIFQADFAAMKIELLMLAGYSLCLFVIIWIMQSVVRKHLFHKIAYARHNKKAKK